LKTSVYVGTLSWDISELALALKLDDDEIEPYFKDGRRISFLLERRLVKGLMRGRLAKSERDPYDIELANGEKWEVRCVTQRGVKFGPSKNTGGSRKFSESDFLDKLKSISGYALCDVTAFPTVQVYKVSSRYVLKLYRAGRLGSTASESSSKKARAIVLNLP
jgi:hypothetical protein